MKFTLMTNVRENPEAVIAGFTRELFERLTPPGVPLVLERFDGLEVGDRVAVRVNLGPLQSRWVSVISERSEAPGEIMYVDEGEELPQPLRFWRHKHRLLRRPGGGCVIRDEIEFRTGSFALDAAVFPTLYANFAYRQPVYRKIFGTV